MSTYDFQYNYTERIQIKTDSGSIVPNDQVHCSLINC